MTTPKELFTRVLRPVKVAPDASPPSPPTPIVHGTTITRRTVNADGSVTVYEFDPTNGERERTLSPDEAHLETAQSGATAAQREGVRVAAALLERDE